jgi:hypothetical protein
MAVKQVFNTSAELDFPNVLPTLDLDFANSKTLDPRITFTRSSGGSYVGADGLIKYAGVNEARFDHDPSSGESLGLLVEEARTNLFTRSEEFDIWNKFNVSVLLNSGSSPDGNFNAIQIIEDATINAHYLSRTTGTITSGLPYTASCFAKSTNPNRFFSLIFEGAALLFEGVNPRASFDLTSGKINTITAATSAKIENYGNGWYRCSVTATPSATGSSAIQLRLQTNVTANVMIGPYTGDGVSGLYIWGAQLEQGAFPTSYIPTQASTRTRAADNASITGKNFSDFYNQSEGTVFSKTKSILTSSNGFIWIIDNSSTATSERMELFRVSTNYRVRIAPPSGSDIIFENIIFSELDLNDFNNCIIAYKEDDSTTFSNARQTFTVSRGKIPILNRLRFSSSGPQVKWITNFKYWPKRLTNQQIRLLTTK